MSKTKPTSGISAKRMELLRQQALAALENSKAFSTKLSADDTLELNGLFEENRVYQAELEIQNDELQIVNQERQLYREHYERIFNSVPLPIIIISEKAVILEANSEASSVLNIDPSHSFLRHSMFKFLDENSGLDLSEAIKTSIENKLSDVLELSLCLEKPSVKAFSAYLLHIDESHSLDERSFLLMLRDLTIEQQLAIERRLFESVIEQNEGQIFAVGQGKEILCHNSNALRQIAHGKNTMHWGDLERVFPKVLTNKILKRLYAQQHRFDLHSELYRFQHQFEDTQETRDYLAKIFHMYIDEHGSVGVGVEITDQTEQLKLDDELRVALSIFDLSSQAIMITDIDQKITYVNQAFELITGYSNSEVLGKDPGILSSGRHKQRFYRRLWRDLKSKGFWSGEIWNRRKSGQEYPEWLQISCYPKEGPTLNYIATFTDISDQKASQQQIHELAYYDPLTGAGNRRLFELEVDTLIKNEPANQSFCVMYLDLDRFKDINDNYGHAVGDSLLSLVVQRLTGALRDSDKVFRLGGDEFVILIYDIDLQQATEKAGQIVKMLQAPFYIKGREVSSSCSAGLVMYPNDGDCFDTLLKHADIAMYKAKHNGKNGFNFFDPFLLSEMERRHSIEHTLRNLLNDKSICIAYQPQFFNQDKSLYGYEALFRIPEGVDPNFNALDYIRVAEDTGLISKVTQYVLERAINTLAKIQAQNTDAKTRISVNLSALDLDHEEQFSKILALMAKHPKQSQFLDFEITESIIMEGVDQKIAQIKQLKEMGAKIMVDDFGTGYSSLAYLTQFAIDVLKIDRTFVKNIGKDKRSESICISIINLAKALGIKCLAEGVETEAQLAFMKRYDCDYTQGYLLGKPKSLSIGTRQNRQLAENKFSS